MARSLISSAVWMALAFGASACLDNKLDPDDVELTGSFLAQQKDFTGYREWMTYERDTVTDHGGLIGTTTVYLNEAPDEGEFRVGTILLKTVKPANSDDVTVHAMAKRGSTYNAQGARGWEYFELLLGKTGTPYIVWRGSQPPSGEHYQQLLGGKVQATTEGNCNDCHADGKDGMLGDDIVNLLD